MVQKCPPSYTQEELHTIADEICKKKVHTSGAYVNCGRLLSEKLNELAVENVSDAEDAFSMLKLFLERHIKVGNVGNAVSSLDLEYLGKDALKHLAGMIEHNLAERNLADALAEVERQIDDYDDYPLSDELKALKIVQGRFETRIDREKKRVNNLRDLDLSTSSNDGDTAKRVVTIGEKDNDAPAEGEELVGKPRLTVDQFIMLMFAIGGSRFKGLDRKEVAEGLSSLTGNSVKQFVKRFSAVLATDKDGIKKFNNQTDAYNRDVEVVCEILTKMGMTDEVTRLKASSNV